MNKIRALISGIILWVMIFSLYTLLSYIPPLKESNILQNSVVFGCVLLFTYICVGFFYKKASHTNSIIFALIMVITPLVLDALITVPFIMQPQNIGYQAFYTEPFLWVMAMEILGLTLLFGSIRKKRHA